jgi:hypothetical protein
LIILGSVGWLALVAVAALVSIIGSAWLPLAAAVVAGLLVAGGAFGGVWLMTWRDVQTTIRGFPSETVAVDVAEHLRTGPLGTGLA